MKNQVKYLIFSIFFPILVFSQPGGRPVSFKIDFSKDFNQTISLQDIVNKYEIRTYIFRNNVQFFEKKEIKNYVYFSNGQGHLNNYGPFLEKNTSALVQKYPGFLEILVENSDNQIKNNRIVSGSILSLQLKDKITKKVMNIFVRINRSIPYVGIHNSIIIKNLSFVEGSFFYDLIGYQYAPVNADFFNNENKDEGSISFSSYSNTISVEKLNSILSQNDCTPPYLNIVAKSTESLNKLLTLYAIQVTNSQDSAFKSDTDDVVRSYQKLLEKNIYMGYSFQDNVSNGIIICLKLIRNLDQKEMYIFFKIYKNYEDFNKNEITLANFSFETGYFYVDMESYGKNHCNAKPRFEDYFDLKNIKDYRITKEQLKNIENWGK